MASLVPSVLGVEHTYGLRLVHIPTASRLLQTVAILASLCGMEACARVDCSSMDAVFPATLAHSIRLLAASFAAPEGDIGSRERLDCVTAWAGGERTHMQVVRAVVRHSRRPYVIKWCIFVRNCWGSAHSTRVRCYQALLPLLAWLLCLQSWSGATLVYDPVTAAYQHTVRCTPAVLR